MHIVLVKPQIPQNTGSIARTCAATETPLHLVEPLGFDLSEKAVRRAGLDYWPYVDLHRHQSWDQYVNAATPNRIWLFTKFATQLYHHASFEHGDALVFGSETTGLGSEFLSQYPESQWLKIPMIGSNVRSLNLSNAAAIALYEARRQLKLDEAVQ
jgi:tRNA (cytidine/uridine-2'-O-)-methyltransferase